LTPVSLHRHPASFRDPAGFIFRDGPHIRRAVTEYGLPHVRAVRATGLIDRLTTSGRLWPEREVAGGLAGHPDVRLVLEHPPLPFVSYGGTSLVMNLIAGAFILQADRHGSRDLLAGAPGR